MSTESLHRQNIVACLWDFDKTLIPGYMQAPLLRAYGIDEDRFWREVNALPDRYARRGLTVAPEMVYLNHLLTHVRLGTMKGLNNARLHELGAQLAFYPGLPGFFDELHAVLSEKRVYQSHGLRLEHYVISTGLAEMIRGSAIAPHVEAVYGCELIENPLPAGFLQQEELPVDATPEVAQIGRFIDNTIKTRYVFEINKGTNKNPEIDVNAKVDHADRRIPIRNMIYIADGPSDVPVFSVVKKAGGRTFAVFDPQSEAEFAQNDRLLQSGRIHAYGPADYTPGSQTHRWLRMHVRQVCDRIVRDIEYTLDDRVSGPPRHVHDPRDPAHDTATQLPPAQQSELFGD